MNAAGANVERFRLSLLQTCEGIVLQDNNSQHILGGYISLAGTLDRLILPTANGTDAFDAGSTNVIYHPTFPAAVGEGM